MYKKNLLLSIIFICNQQPAHSAGTQDVSDNIEHICNNVDISAALGRKFDRASVY